MTASVFCTHCSVCLCSDCSTRLHSAASKTMAKHVRVSVNERPSLRLLCLTHQRPMDLYCAADETAICDYCAQFGAHKGHADIDIIGNVTAACTAKVNEKVNEATHARQTLQEKAVAIQSAMSSATKAATAARETVRNAAQQLRACITKRENQLLASILTEEQVSFHFIFLIAECVYGIPFISFKGFCLYFAHVRRVRCLFLQLILLPYKCSKSNALSHCCHLRPQRALLRSRPESWKQTTRSNAAVLRL